MTDQKIALLFANEPNKAISEVDKKYGQMLFQLAEAIVRNPLDAAECVNDCYLALWENVPNNLRRLDRLGAYSKAIVANRAKTRYVENVKRNVEVPFEYDEFKECVLYMEEWLEEYEIIEIIDKTGATISADAFRIFCKKNVLGHSINEIAKSEGVSEGSVKMHLHRTKNKLIEALSQAGIQI